MYEVIMLSNLFIGKSKNKQNVTLISLRVGGLLQYMKSDEVHSKKYVHSNNLFDSKSVCFGKGNA